MLAREFNKFCQPYFYDYSPVLIPVQDATRLHAETFEFKSHFDFSHVEDLPLHDLVAKHILELPQDTVFISNGPQSDVFERFFSELLPYYNRTDITFMPPCKQMSVEWLEENVDQYFISHPYSAHKIKTMESLIKQGRTCGSMNPFVYIKKLVGRIWVVQEHFSIVNTFLLGKKYPDMFIPCFTLPFARAFIRDMQLPRCRLGEEADQIGPVVMMRSLLAAKGQDVSLVQHIDISDDWNLYPNLINRSWTHAAYHQLEDFF